MAEMHFNYSVTKICLQPPQYSTFPLDDYFTGVWQEHL